MRRRGRGNASPEDSRGEGGVGEGKGEQGRGGVLHEHGAEGNSLVVGLASRVNAGTGLLNGGADLKRVRRRGGKRRRRGQGEGEGGEQEKENLLLALGALHAVDDPLDEVHVNTAGVGGVGDGGGVDWMRMRMKIMRRMRMRINMRMRMRIRGRRRNELILQLRVLGMRKLVPSGVRSSQSKTL